MFDTEKFIHEIENRPALYNPTVKEYSYRETKTELWMEIGAIMHKNWHNFSVDKRNKLGRELKIKWKSIRDHFRKELELEKKLQSGEAIAIKKRYIYYDQLCFLKTAIQERKTPVRRSKRNYDHNLTVKVENTEIVQHDTSPECNNKIQDIDREDNCDTITNDSNDSHRIIYSEEDPMGNRAFLLSLLPLLNAIPQENLIYFRYKIMELMHNISQPVLLSHSHNLPSMGVLSKDISARTRAQISSALSEESHMSENSM